MQRNQILRHTLILLEQHGFALMTLETIAKELSIQLTDIIKFWPNLEALCYDCLCFHSQQIDVWRQQVSHDNSLSLQQKLLAYYSVLSEQLRQQRYPGCLFIAACIFFPDTNNLIHHLAEQQKRASLQHIRMLLCETDADDPTMVAQQMELIWEGCRSKLMIKRQLQDVENARQLAEDILEIALCRKNGALG